MWRLVPATAIMIGFCTLSVFAYNQYLSRGIFANTETWGTMCPYTTPFVSSSSELHKFLLKYVHTIDFYFPDQLFCHIRNSYRNCLTNASDPINFFQSDCSLLSPLVDSAE